MGRMAMCFAIALMSWCAPCGVASTGFVFQLAGITRTVNQAWFERMAFDLDLELQAKIALRQGGPEILNL